MSYKPLRVISDLPRTALLHPERPYVPSHKTDLQATFARIRDELAQAAASAPTPIRKRKAIA